MSTPSDRLYEIGSGLAVPGVEATLEYGDASTVRFDRIPGALLINDLSPLEKVRLSNLDGLHDDPEGRTTNAPNADRHGERSGIMLYGGRTIGLTGRVEAGNIAAMRDLWARLRSTFGTAERDLLIHPPDEVLSYVNLVKDPNAQSLVEWSSTAPATVAADAGYGVFSIPSGASGSFVAAFNKEGTNGWAWSGEDVWIHCLVKVHSTTTSVSSIALRVMTYTGVSGLGSVTAASISSPATGNWYRLSARVPAGSLDPLTQRVQLQILVGNATGTHVIRLCRAALVMLPPSVATPKYFDGDTAGFEWSSSTAKSSSSGPHYAVNEVYDPLFTKTSSDSDPTLTYWGYVSATGVTTAGPQVSRAFKGSMSDGSAALDFTKDSGTTSRNFEANAHSVRVEPGRSYRWSCTFKQQPVLPTGTLKLRLRWTTVDGAALSSTDGAAITDATGEASMTAIAPDGAAQCVPAVLALGVTTSSLHYVLYLADPCLVDVTDYDPGTFGGTSELELESPPLAQADMIEPARRRIPRPFRLVGVRKTSDAKSPEQQSNLRYQRSFTMSLRANDPRIYVFGQRARSLRMTGTPQFVVRQMPVDFSLNAGSLIAPTGWTYEGHFVTHPGSGTPYNWSQDAYNWPLLGGAPISVVNNGVTIKSWDTSGAHGANRPAQDLVARAYRSGEGYTYTSPRVVMGCSPQSTGQAFATGNVSRMAYYSDLAAVLSYANNVTVLLKRVNATTWLELRWYSMSVAASGGGPNPHYAFELWCSHDVSGSLSTTKLAAWDYASYNSASGQLPFNPLVDQMYLVSSMLANVVYWELWRGYPSTSSTANRVESGGYFVPAGLQSIIGTSVAGSVGMSLGISKTASQSAFNGLSNTPPFVNYFEASKADVPAQSVTCPVIGSIDTPQVIQLRGDMIDPVVTITVPALDDKPAATSVAKFSGTLPEAAPVLVDMKDGSVLDVHGANQYGMMLHGSSFETFRPGLNVVSVQAKSWSTSALDHAIATWNDALR